LVGLSRRTNLGESAFFEGKMAVALDEGWGNIHGGNRYKVLIIEEICALKGKRGKTTQKCPDIIVATVIRRRRKSFFSSGGRRQEDVRRGSEKAVKKSIRKAKRNTIK